MQFIKNNLDNFYRFLISLLITSKKRKMWEIITNHIDTTIVPALKITTINPNLTLRSTFNINYTDYDFIFKEGKITLRVEVANGLIDIKYRGTDIEDLTALSDVFGELSRVVRLSKYFIVNAYNSYVELKGKL